MTETAEKLKIELSQLSIKERAELEEFIWVVAIAHGKRRPDYWRRQQIE